MENFSIVVGMCNTPQGHRDKISYPPTQRVKFLVEQWNKEGVVVGVLNEFGPALSEGWRESKNWSVIRGTNNNLPHQRPAMNAIAYRNDVLKPLATKNLRFRLKVSKGRYRYIHMPVVLFKHIKTNTRFVVIGIHVPTRRDASEARRKTINMRIMRYANKCLKNGLPVIVAGDRNDGKIFPWNTARWKVGVRHTIDWILGKRVVFDSPNVIKLKGKVTDHFGSITVEATLKVDKLSKSLLP